MCIDIICFVFTGFKGIVILFENKPVAVVGLCIFLPLKKFHRVNDLPFITINFLTIGSFKKTSP